MGKKGREIVSMDVERVIKALKAAYADEWLAHHAYLYAAYVATGLSAPQVSQVLKTRSANELNHALRIGERILELGGQLPSDWAEIPRLAHCRQYDWPKDRSDLKGMLQVVLKAERCAIETYKALCETTLHKDTVTHELAEDLLADEVRDEEETENLIGRA